MLLSRRQMLFILLVTSTSLAFFSTKEGSGNVNVTVTQGDMNSTNNNQNHLASNINLQNAITLLKSMAGKCKDGADKFLEFAWDHKYKLTITAIVGFYLYILHKIKRCKELMENPDSWCCWNSSMETTELTALPYSKIHKKIIGDIQKKYMINQQKIEFFDSFNEFIQEIKYEVNILKSYINLHNKIIRHHAQSVFFMKQETLNLAQEKLQRVMFIYNTFVTWHTNKNIDQPA
jgi:hypothetical protein